jgi:hypothetical protein
MTLTALFLIFQHSEGDPESPGKAASADGFDGDSKDGTEFELDDIDTAEFTSDQVSCLYFSFFYLGPPDVEHAGKG